MEIIYLSYPPELNKEELPKTVAAIGFFDGLHKGHQAVIQFTIDKAKKDHMESAVITFYPHPSVVLKNNHDVHYITPLKEKQAILEKLGVDRVYIIKFNKELSAQSPQAFIDDFIIGLNIQHVVAGFDFTYGHKGQGNMAVIGEQSHGKFTYTVIDKLTRNDEKVSSTKIRSLLDAGDVKTANILLGRALSTSGIVIEGDKRGRELGYPTANINFDPEAHLPKPGIYAVRVLVQGTYYGGLASLGTNPTFTENRQDLSLEVNILDFDKNIYGEEIVVEWYKFIRNEEKFASVEQLIKRMSIDEMEIRNYLATLS